MKHASRISPRFCILGLAFFLLLPLLSPAPFSYATPASASEFDFDDWLERPPFRTAGTFSRSDSAHLSEAYGTAVDRLRAFPQCRSLFEQLGGDGETFLSKSLYVRAKSHHETQICGRRVAAFTAVGSPVTRLCRNFRRLDAEQGALILIHEALHYAGMPEAPHEPDAPTSQEINSLVASSCDL